MMGKKRHIAAIAGAAASVLLLTGGTTIAQAEGLDEVREFHIEAQSLDAALIEFSEQADLQLVVQTELVAGRQSPGVNGALTSSDALVALLNDSELSFTAVGDDTVAVSMPDAGGDSELGNGRTAGATPKAVMMAQASEEPSQSRRTETETSEDEVRRPLEEIIVTGTNIRGVLNSASPVLSYDREDLELTGLSTTQDFLETLPQNFTIVGIDNNVGGSRITGQPINASAGSGVDLRGLGPTATLTLLNGRRIAPSSTGQFVDVSLIPLTAIERIEVLTDGASAVYGSDAIAGVFNFVLRDDYDGAESRVRYGTVTEGVREEFQASQLVGKTWDSGHILASYEYLKRTNLDANDRPFSADIVPDPSDLLPRESRHSALFSASKNLNRSVEVFAEGLYARREVERRIVVSGDPRNQAIDNDGYNIVGGVRIDIGDSWRTEVSGSHSKNKLIGDQQTTAGLIDDSDLKNGTTALEVKSDGPLFQLPGGEVKFAFGGGYRRDTYVRFNTSTVFQDSSRKVYSAFGETLIPIVGSANSIPGIEQLEVSAAGRFDHYSDVGSVAKPKVGVLWSPISGLTFRSTYSSSFRAPLLDDLDTSFRGVFLFNLADPTAVDGTTLALIQQGNDPNMEPEEAKNWTAGIQYQPDVLSGLNIDVTYFRVNYTDRIAAGAAGFAILGVFQDEDIFAPIITRSPDPTTVQAIIDDASTFLDFTGQNATANDVEAILDARVRNLARTKVTGVDVNIEYAFESDVGDFTLSANGNYLFTRENAITPTAPFGSTLNTTFNPVDLRVRGRASWSLDGWEAAAFVNYTDGYSNNLVSPEVPADSWTTIDFRVAYDTGERSSSRSPLENVVIAASVQNLLNNRPPAVEIPPATPTAAGFDPANASPLGRFISFQITKRW